ncbi:hypothetical protein BJX96DRAFT_175972 [Aspergillus floccosus]
MASARLDTIPLEMLVEILSYLPEFLLPELSLTCKTLHYRIKPLVYRSIEWRFNIRGTLDLPDPPIRLFLRSLRENPALAGHVKSIFFGAHVDTWPVEKFEDLPPSSDEARWWTEALKELCPPFQEILKAGTFAGEPGPLMALLLCQLPNLEILYLEFTVALWSDLLDILFEHHQSPSPRCTCPLFPKMKQLHISNDQDCLVLRNGRLTAKQLSTVLGLTSLEILEIVLHESTLTPRFKEATGQLPKLKTLRMTNCGASMETVASWLSTAPNLHTYEYFRAFNMEDLKYDRHYEHGHWDEWKHFTSALATVSETLKGLIISVDWGHIDDYPPDTMDDDWLNKVWQRQGSLGSLKSLTSLERLESPIWVLLGWTPDFPATRLRDRLPSTLRELALRDDLFEEPDYQWTSWDRPNSQVLKKSGSIGDSTPIIDQLRDYLPGRLPDDKDHPARSLTSLCLKVQTQRVWSLSELKILEEMSRWSGVLCTVHERKRGFYEDIDDTVRQIVVHDPLSPTPEDAPLEVSKYTCRRLREPSRVFMDNC